MSTFHGLEMAKQALFAQQSALYTTGHNISNANTPGYTRQRVNFETLPAFPTGSRNRPEIPGQLGTGVEAGTVQRVRNQYLDYQYRTENSKTGYWATKADALSRMERLMNEPSESGLSKVMDQFWQSLQDLSVNPENSGARSVVAQRGQAVAETFNYLSDSLNSIRTDLKSQIDVTVKDANSLIRQINSINDQIKNVEPHGYLPNDLYDERDRLIDELSGIVNIKVTYDKSSDSSLDIADGLATIEIVDDEGKSLNTPPLLLVDGKGGSFQELSVNYAGDDQSNAITQIMIGNYDDDGNFTANETFDVAAFNSNGSLRGFIDSYGYTTGTNPAVVTGEYTDMIDDLNLMAKEFAEAFNTVHEGGYGLDGSTDIPFFDKQNITAGNIKINSAILDNPDLIAAGQDGTSGNGDNASALADVFDKELSFDGENTSVKTFYESIIGDLGVRAQEANRMAENTGILRSQVQDQRMSVSSVSLDEEMANMIKFQHAYNAAARSMTAVDEMIDRIINNMGIVGR
ncbi:flagellar hook-associated protein FlgK [Virgibacillus oceani]|uniref:Flagellar hook-associated protein 1 n=1 Tax=Virgibacillus oceani TaxID=1479511 RepID=A0A917H462_9BACI|nr:flagellar hook-associated protein FlgK [Virgibacillus oceani]GGG67379.1 flagellar hook-associated protein 1 [Virgibacillus oceani]